MDHTVISGIGMISAAGLDLEENFRNFNLKKNGIGRITRFELDPKSRIDMAGQAPTIPTDRINPDLMACMNDEDLRQDFVKAAVCVVFEAIAEAGVAGLIAAKPHRIGLFVASSVGNLLYVSDGYKEWCARGVYKLTQIIHGMNSYLPSRLAALFGIKGPALFVSSACTSALNAILQADTMIKAGVIDRAIVCSVDICLEAATFLCWNRIRVLSHRIDDPATASRPYCKTRDGLVLAEAAGCFVLERESESGRGDSRPPRARPPYARIRGIGTSNGSTDILMPSQPDIDHAIRDALDNAQVAPDQIDFIAGSASGSPHADHLETQAIRDIFGEAATRVPLFSFKSHLGTTFGTQAVTEGALALRGFRENRLPEVRNIFEPDERVRANAYYNPDDYRGYAMNRLLFINYGFSGNHMAIIYDRPES